MAGKQDVLDMLDFVGAERIACGTAHMKFRLPNKKMFVAPSTPSDHLSWDNSLAQLRRALRETHPEIASWRRNYTPPKSKRSYGELAKMPGVSLGELLANHPHRFDPKAFGLAMPVPSEVAIPGSEPVRQEQVHFQIFDEVEPVVVEEVVRTHDAYKPPRIQHEPRPKPAPVKTLTKEQLAEANRRLHRFGSVAMDSYLKECHEQLVPATTEIVRERRVEAKTNNQSAGEEKNVNPMQGLVDRAKTELDVLGKRIDELGSEIECLKAKRDAETEKQLKLEQFIEKYNRLIEESADVLQTLPPLPIAEIAKMQGLSSKAKAYGRRPGFRHPDDWFGVREIREVVVPKFRNEGRKEFTVDDVIAELDKLPGKKVPSRDKMAGTIYAETQGKAPSYRKGIERGVYILNEVTA